MHILITKKWTSLFFTASFEYNNAAFVFMTDAFFSARQKAAGNLRPSHGVIFRFM